MADYAISNVVRRVVYTNTGVGPYAFTFEVLANTDIAVYRGSTLLTLTTDYSVTINSNGTGSVTLVTAGTGNITIVGARAIQRTSDYTTGGDLFASTLNTDLDSQTIYAQQVAETAERGLKAPVIDPTDINMTLPAKASRAGTVLAFNATTGNPEAGPSIASVTTVAAQSANINTVATNIASVNTVAGISGNVTTVAGVSGNVTTVAGSISNVNTVADDLNEGVSEINTVAVNIADVNTVGTNIANVNTVAGISANVTTVAGISANVTTVAGNNANVSTVAGISGNVTTVAGISANVTTVAGISSNVSTVATNNANVTTVATNIASVNTNATNIVAIQNASTNATNAANSATAAAASAASAAASFDAFDDIYLGAKASNPTVDNDGDALTTGDQYFNTVSNELRVWNGSSWQAASVIGGTITTLGVTGVATFSAGTVSAPSITTTGDTNTGIFFPTADTIAFTEGGVESMRIDSSGNVGIGTSSPGARLDVNGGRSFFAANSEPYSIYLRYNGSTSGFFIGSPSADTMSFSTSNGSEKMRIDSSGNVLIGTTSTYSAYTRLHALNGLAVAVDASNAGRIVGATTGGTELSYLTMGGNYNLGSTGEIALATTTAKAILFGTNSAERMRIDSSGNVGVRSSGTTTPTYDFNTLGEGLWSRYWDSSGNRFADLVAIGNTPAGATMSMRFFTNTGSAPGTAVERMRIDSSGRVLVGQTSSNGTASIAGVQSRTGFSCTTTNGEVSGLFVTDSNADNSLFIGADQDNLRAGSYIAFGVDATERMRITSSGDLLLGTTTNGYSAKQLNAFDGTSRNGIVLNETANSSNTVYAAFLNALSEIGSIRRVGATSAVVYNTTSDQRLKSNIADANPVLDKLMTVKVRQFDWTEGDLHQDAGFIAQELAPVLSGIVTQGKKEEDMWQMDYSRLTPYLVKAIQEQQALIESLTIRLTALENK